MTKWGVVAIALALAGCGSDVDLTGIYRVTYHTQTDQSCEVEGPAPTDPVVYFQLEKDEFFGQDFFVFGECDSTDPTSCSGGGLFFGLIFSIPTNGGWRGEISAASGFGDPCTLTYGESSAIVQDDDSVRIETRTWSESVTVTEEQCSTDEASSRGKSMPCDDFQVLIGDPVVVE